jgi:hypothetical protein
MDAAVEAPRFQCEFKGFQDVAERYVVGGAAANAVGNTVDAVGLVLENLPWQVRVCDGHPRAFHSQSSSSAMK